MAAAAKLWLLETRPHFLLLTPVSVFTAVAVALWERNSLDWGRLALAFLGALLAHIAVNVLNDYFDFRSGIDLATQRTPFSGGSGMLPAGLLKPRSVYVFGLACLLALIPIGAYFVAQNGVTILPLGIAGMLMVYYYTTHITRDPSLCLAAPGLGFGPLMVLGTYFSQAGTYSWAAGAASVVPGFLVSNLLLVNQFPDVEADARAARRHLPIVLGRTGSARVYAALLFGTYAWLGLSVVLRLLPAPALLGLLTLPLASGTARGVLRHATNLESLVPLLGRNVLVTLLTPSFMALGILMAHFLT